MLFRTATSAAILACAASVAAKPAPAPYKLAVMALPGQSLARRDTMGYQPDTTECTNGNTCEEACGTGYAECPSTTDSSIHCFNAAAHQSCCNDGSGNSCDAGYYCTSDHQSNTWCCPDSMDLAECAAAYSVVGGLETPEPTSTEASSTSSSSSTSTSSTPSTTPTPTETPTPTPTPSTSSTPASTPVTTKVKVAEVTTCPGNNSTATPVHGSNSTATGGFTVPPTVVLPTTPGGEAPATTSAPPAAPTAGAATSGVSLALLVAAAGVVAMF